VITVRGAINGASQTVSALSTLPGLLVQTSIGAVTEILVRISRVSRDEYLSGPFPHRLEPRSGRLRASMRRGDSDNLFEVKAQGTKITGVIGTKVPYAKTHEFGGIIKPTKGQYLAIPTSLAKTPRGIIKAEFNRPLRSIPGLFLMRSKRGNLGAYRRRGRRGALERLFSLVRQVRIFPRPFLHTAVNRVRPEIPTIFMNRFDQVLKRMQETISRVRGAR
jgi:hypothetical protein